MKDIKLTPIDVTRLDVFTNPYHLRKDLHAFVDYIRSREVKRSHRSNELSKADQRRLAKVLSDPEALDQIKEYGDSGWVYYIDELAFSLGFIRYDTEGTYAGYSSQEPSYPDNYIEFKTTNYEKFLTLSLAEREHDLLERLINAKGASEFLNRSPLGCLDSFSSWGSGLGMLPLLDFPEARWFLLDMLNRCQGGVWYSTASLVQYLKNNHPHFLIPQKLPVAKVNKWGRSPQPITRYGNFHESTESTWGHEIDISESDPDAFERVEGRYVERFLENIPLTLNYVDVAYGQPSPKNLYPSRNALRAFRVSKRFLQLMQGQLPAPKVTVQPNFEIQVESPFYPVKTLHQLAPLTDLVADDTVTILKLNKKKVTTQLAADDSLDVTQLLQDLSVTNLPQNIVMELEEWSGHSDVFTVYDGFGLFEGKTKLATVANLSVEEITPTLKIVRAPASVFMRLEENEQIPLLINHGHERLKPLPDKAKTIFVKQAKLVAKAKKKQALLLKRETAITLHFPNAEILEEYRQALVVARCPIAVDKSKWTLTYTEKYQTLAKVALKAMQQKYRIKIEDMN